MATKKHDRGYAGIRTYEELESAIRMIRRQEDMNQVSRQMSQFRAGNGFSLRWTDVALVAIQALRRRLLR